MRSLFFTLLLLGCHPYDVRPTPAPEPEPQPVHSACADMCQAIGPVQEGGLGCEEGNSVYDSDLPGKPGVPNESCTDFCGKQQKNGIDLKPQCVAKVRSCSEIEPARQQCGL